MQWSMSVERDVVPVQMLHDIDHVWPATSWDGWYKYSGHYGDKLASLHAKCLPIECVAALGIVAAKMQSRFHNLIVDWTLHGAGMHQINRGGSLPAHYDAECHPRETMWLRAVSAVLFLDTMQEQDGGELVVADEVIRPVRGSLAMFETPNCLHEVKQVHTERRRTLALFGYVRGKTDGLRSSANFI